MELPSIFQQSDWNFYSLNPLDSSKSAANFKFHFFLNFAAPTIIKRDSFKVRQCGLNILGHGFLFNSSFTFSLYSPLVTLNFWRGVRI